MKNNLLERLQRLNERKANAEKELATLTNNIKKCADGKDLLTNIEIRNLMGRNRNGLNRFKNAPVIKIREGFYHVLDADGNYVVNEQEKGFARNELVFGFYGHLLGIEIPVAKVETRVNFRLETSNRYFFSKTQVISVFKNRADGLKTKLEQSESEIKEIMKQLQSYFSKKEKSDGNN